MKSNWDYCQLSHTLRLFRTNRGGWTLRKIVSINKLQSSSINTLKPKIFVYALDNYMENEATFNAVANKLKHPTHKTNCCQHPMHMLVVLPNKIIDQLSNANGFFFGSFFTFLLVVYGILNMQFSWTTTCWLVLEYFTIKLWVLCVLLCASNITLLWMPFESVHLILWKRPETLKWN